MEEIARLAKEFIKANEAWMKISLEASTSPRRNKALCRKHGKAWEKKNKAYEALKQSV